MVETLIYEKPAADDEHQPVSTWRTKNRNFVTRSIVPAVADALPEETVSLLRYVMTPFAMYIVINAQQTRLCLSASREFRLPFQRK